MNQKRISMARISLMSDKVLMSKFLISFCVFYVEKSFLFFFVSLTNDLLIINVVKVYSYTYFRREKRRK